MNKDQNGWSVPEGQVIHVNSEVGRDDSPNGPFKTLKRAVEVAKLQANPIVIQASGVFGEGLSIVANKNPIYVVGVNCKITHQEGRTIVDLLRIGEVGLFDIDFTTEQWVSKNKKPAIRLVEGGDFHLEGCRIWDVAYGFEFGGTGPDKGVRNVTIRRNVIHDTWCEFEDEKAMGGYGNWTQRALIEENVLDVCGYKLGQSWPAHQVILMNHCLYFMETINEIIVRRNLISRACSHGLQVRGGGLVQENLFYKCPIGALTEGNIGIHEGNVVFGSQGMAGGQSPSTHRFRGWGLTSGSHDTRFTDNRIIRGGGGDAGPCAFRVQEIKRTSNPVGASQVAWTGKNIVNWDGEPVRVTQARQVSNGAPLSVEYKNLVTPVDLQDVLEYRGFRKGQERLNPSHLWEVMFDSYSLNPLYEENIGLKAHNLELAKRVVEQEGKLTAVKGKLDEALQVLHL